MSETVIVCVTDRQAFERALRTIMKATDIIDNGTASRPALIAPGHPRPVYIDEHPTFIEEAVGIDDISPAMVRDEIERALGRREAYCVALHYRDVDLMRQVLGVLLTSTPALVDNDHELRAPGQVFLDRLRRDPEWNLTDP